MRQILKPDPESPVENAQVMFPPTDWAKSEPKGPCFTCEKKRNEHHCRLCGEAFCSDCSTKSDEVPAIFRKKNKKGSVHGVLFFLLTLQNPLYHI